MTPQTPKPQEKIPKNYIQIPIDEVWELLDKPGRFFGYLYKQVNNLPCGEYQFLDFNKKTKKELLKRITIYIYNNFEKVNCYLVKKTGLIKKYSKFIKCEDCTVITMNDDDNVCLKCGSKNTKRLFMGNKVFNSI